jgi:hypothetical protein
MTGEEFEIGAGAALLDDAIQLIWLSGVFALAADDDIHLPAPRLERAQGAACAKEHEFGDVAEIEAHAAPVRPAIFARFVPYQIGLVGKAPALHHLKPFKDECIGHPQVQMALRQAQLLDGEIQDIVERHCGIAREPPVFGRHFPRAVRKLPGRIG